MIEQQRGEQAFELHQKIANNEEKRRELMIENIIYLEKMRDEELYQDYLGDKNAKWVAYLSELEVFYTRAKVQRWIYIMQRLVKPYGVSLNDLLSIPESRLEQVARYATPDNWQNLKEQAKILTSTDWNIVLSKIKGIDLENCKHEDTQKIEVCNNCGKKHKLE